MRYFVALAIFSLATALGGSPSPGYPSAMAADSTCASRVLKGIARPHNHAKVVPLSLDDFKRLYVLEYKTPVTNADNLRYSKIERAASPTPRLFFEMDVPVLKELNDRVFQDQDIATAVINKYREIFFDVLKQEEFSHVRKQLAASYWDYKTLRFIFNSDTPALRRALGEIYRRTSTQFKASMDQLWIQKSKTSDPIRFNTYFENYTGLVSDPAALHLAGMGSSFEEAGVTARAGRILFPSFKPGQPKALQFDQVAQILEQRLWQIETYRKQLEGTIPLDSGILTTVTHTLSADSIEILRKAQTATETAGRSRENYFNFLRSQFEKRFAVRLSDPELHAIRDYFTSANTFSPGMIFTQPKLAPYTADGGGLFVDFVGLGSKDAQVTLTSLIPSETVTTTSASSRVSSALKKTRADMKAFNQQIATRKDQLHAATTGGNPEKKKLARLSGDEFDYYAELTASDKNRVLKAALSQSSPADIRTAYIPPRYADGTVIQAVDRKELKELALTLEKQIRSTLDAKALRPELSQLQIHVDFLPNNPGGSGRYDLVLTSRSDISPQLLPKIQAALKKAVATRPQSLAGEIRLNR